MFEQRFCIECGKPKKMVRTKCKECGKTVCWNCSVSLESGVDVYCIFCAERIIHNRIKRTAKSICSYCGAKIKDVKFTHCPYCGNTLRKREEKCKLNK